MTRGEYFVEQQHKAQIAVRDRERAQRFAVQKHNAAVRLAEQNRKAAELAEKRRVCANEAERKRLEKDARESYITAAETDAEERNHKLEEVYGQVDSLLTTSLKLDSSANCDRMSYQIDGQPRPGSGSQDRSHASNLGNA